MRTLVSAVAFSAIVFVGCNNDFSRNRAAAGGDDLVLRAHFVGSEQLLRDKNAPKLVEVWNLKSSAVLRNDALNKFSRLPTAWMGSALPKGASDNANLFRPILEDALVNESFVEWHASSFALLAKLPEARAKAWDNSLQQVATTWKLGKSVKAGNGWEISAAGGVSLRLARSGEWTAITMGQGAAALESSALARATARKTSGAWLEGDANLVQWKGRLPLLENFSNLPAAHFSFSNRADFVRTLVQFDFPKPHQWKSEPWLFPTNFIWDPLVDFTVARGIGDVLGKVPFMHNLGLKPMPSQFCGWGNRDLPFQFYYSAPSRDVVRQLKQIEPRLRAEMKKAAGPTINGDLASTTNSLYWSGLPTTPLLASMKDGKDEFVFLQFAPLMRTKSRPPQELFAQISGNDLVMYDWEASEYRFPNVRQLYTLGELLTRRRLAATNAAHIAWQLEVAPHLADSITELRATGPSQMKLARKSSVGFTAFELATLSRWIESVNFPAFDAFPSAPGSIAPNRPAGKSPK
jgi:hypothetical protein